VGHDISHGTEGAVFGMGCFQIRSLCWKTRASGVSRWSTPNRSHHCDRVQKTRIS
jgi:hypothetical protein